MEVGATARVGLIDVNRYIAVVGHNSKESSLLVPDPASNAGAYGSGHRNRLNAGVSSTRFAVSSRLASVETP
jgi:hypothetical protein